MAKRDDKPVVLIGAPTYLPRQGGSSTYFSNLIKRLDSKVDFIVYSCVHPDAPRQEIVNGVRILRIQPFLVDHPKPLRYLILPPVTLVQLARLWFKYGPFIIHAHACGAYGYIISFFSKIMNAEMLKEVQDMSDPAYNIHMGRVTRYVSTGYTIEKQLISYGVPAERILTYPSLNPDIDPDIRKRLEPKPHAHDGSIELLCISALRPYKGVDHLLRSMRLVQKKDPTIHCTVIGEGGMRQELEAYMEKHGLKNVTLRGFLDSYEDVLKAMAGCDILVLSSVSDEGNPRVILESFQFERPVIATAAGGTPELIVDGINGRLLKPRDHRAFARAILELSGDAALRKKLGKGGRRFLERLPTWDDLANDIYSDYRGIWKRMQKGR